MRYERVIRFENQSENRVFQEAKKDSSDKAVFEERKIMISKRNKEERRGINLMHEIMTDKLNINFGGIFGEESENIADKVCEKLSKDENIIYIGKIKNTKPDDFYKELSGLFIKYIDTYYPYSEVLRLEKKELSKIYLNGQVNEVEDDDLYKYFHEKALRQFRQMVDIHMKESIEAIHSILKHDRNLKKDFKFLAHLEGKLSYDILCNIDRLKNLYGLPNRIFFVISSTSGMDKIEVENNLLAKKNIREMVKKEFFSKGNYINSN